MPKEKQSLFRVFLNGIISENPIFRLVLGVCSALAVTTSIENAFGMGIAVTFVLVCSNMFVSLLRKQIPEKVRIPVFVVLICTFVTVVELCVKAYVPALDKSLGVFLPLIVVNCIIFARAEAFAFTNTVPAAIVDGLGSGIGYTIALVLMSAVREIVGTGSIMGVQLFGSSFEPMLLFVLAPGAFITYGILLGVFNLIVSRAEKKKLPKGGAEA